VFPLALFRNPARVARRRTRTVDGADVRAVEGRPGSTAFSVHRGTSSLFVAGRRRNSLGRGGFRLTRTTPRGGRPPAGPEAHSFARREPSETRAASRDHGGRAEGEQGPDAGEGASRAPRGRGRGRRAARGPGRWDARAFFRAERGERRSRSPPTDANDAGERRKGPREGAREGARAARERREARGTPSATNPSRGRVASRTASRPRTRAAPGKIARNPPRLPLGASIKSVQPPPRVSPRVTTDSILRPVRPTNADDARPEPTPPRRVSPSALPREGLEPSLDARARGVVREPAAARRDDGRAAQRRPTPPIARARRATAAAVRRPLPALVHATDAIVLGTGTGTPGTPGTRDRHPPREDRPGRTARRREGGGAPRRSGARGRHFSSAGGRRRGDARD